LDGPRLTKYLLAEASELIYNDTSYVAIADGRLNCGLSGGKIHIDRYDADFAFYAPGVDDIYYRTQRIYAISADGYLTPDPATGTTEVAPSNIPFQVSAYPNPLNPSTVIQMRLPERAYVTARIYDCAGRIIGEIHRGELPQGLSSIPWNGTDAGGGRVASGVYFLRIRGGGYSKSIKLVVVK
jgi:hypothetical protein